MLEKFYAGKTEKELKSYLNVYSALLILSIVMPILFNAISFYINGTTHLKASLIFVLIFIWSVINFDYLKNKLKHKSNKRS